MAVLLETSQGDLVIDLYTEDCPIATKNFLKLCKIKYYNNCLFYNVQKDFIAQTGDPTNTGKGGESVYGKVYGEQAKVFEDEFRKNLRHDKVGVVSMAAAADDANGSAFFVTTRADNLDYLDDTHTIFGQVAEGFETLTKINDAFVDPDNVPWQVIRIKHTIVLEDPFEDMPGLAELVPGSSPRPAPDPEGRLAEDVDIEENEYDGMTTEEIDSQIRARDAKGKAITLKIIGDIPDEDVEPPDDTLFVCKLNPITEDEDLELIFSRFGPVRCCNIVREPKSGDSLCYAFIEFEDAKASEEAYFKMENVLIDERRIHVDFSQSVGKLWNQFNRGESAAIHDREGFGDYDDGGKGKGKGKGKGGGGGCYNCGGNGHFARECTEPPGSNGGKGNGGGGKGKDGGRGEGTGYKSDFQLKGGLNRPGGGGGGGMVFDFDDSAGGQGGGVGQRAPRSDDRRRDDRGRDDRGRDDRGRDDRGRDDRGRDDSSRDDRGRDDSSRDDRRGDDRRGDDRRKDDRRGDDRKRHKEHKPKKHKKDKKEHKEKKHKHDRD